ncbi:hypothetical protein J2X06_000318 [Lysobacter niastensis]|uniref:Uncharacterized protein n=1 Tax=Lysobacter niastensis TaxID=380629 RepID=A0ABU1W6N2_9GAMM|nr:hypothetical protein [Lysobacter niastensis]MDR7133134.1 hypothetical protein [Lysobacter niastensis]
MGTILECKNRFLRGSALPPVKVTAFGFCVGQDHVAWPSVAEIRAYKVDRLTTGEAFLEFIFGAGQGIRVSEEQPGFDELEAAMIAVFPTNADWRQAVLMPPFEHDFTLLFRRG